MFKKKNFLRNLALFLAINTLSQIVFPAVSYALTSGPTAPEATDFEPVDTTDMVNLLTGDMTYNIPLMEVPGPAGGYPLNMAYHAGIMPNEEASWVGLGWNLNTGAINRNVNGYADDHQDVSNTVRDYWEGGETTTYNVGISVGVASSPASVSFGLAFSQDTYKGFGTGAYAGIGYGVFSNSNVSVGINAKVGISPYGGAYASSGIGASIGKTGQSGLRLGVGAGVSYSGSGASYGGGVSVSYSDTQTKKDENGKITQTTDSYSLLGASISSGALKPSLSLGGGAMNAQNSKAGAISTDTRNYGADIPLPGTGVAISLGYDYVRYWSDESETTKTNGSLYPVILNDTYKNASSQATIDGFFQERAYDTHSFLDLTEAVKENPSPENGIGGTFSNFDNYNVQAQGLTGNIKPYLFATMVDYQHQKYYDQEAGTYKYNLFNEGHKIIYNTNVKFRFINDFSNKYLIDETVRFTELAANSGRMLDINYNNLEAQTMGLMQEGHLAGSKHVDWYTNAQILDGSSNGAKAKGFIENRATGFNRISTNSKQIGGFSITNETGVTYHFSLPAYAYNEYVYTENIRREAGHTFNELVKKEPYAYTWFLTAITGPDFVDRNEDGLVNEGDWGYWVEFNYGKWTDKYRWRNPGTGYHQDLDNNFHSYSTGLKEIYYLDAVKTASHTALFIKNERNDAKSAVLDPIKELVARRSWEGGFAPITDVSSCHPRIEGCEREDVTYYIRPKGSLKLDKVLLFKNEDLTDINELKGGSNLLDYSFTYAFELGDCCSDIIDSQSADLSLDVYDLSSNLLKKAIKGVELLNNNYSLMQQTPNSYSNKYLRSRTPVTTIPTNELTGKLTLKGIKFLGKNASEDNIVPPINFNYEKSVQSSLRITSLDFGKDVTVDLGFSTPYSIGDILSFVTGGVTYWGVLVSNTSGSLYKFRLLNDKPTSTTDWLNCVSTKNPPYVKDLVDTWGMFKSDRASFNDNDLSKVTSSVSAKSVDVWSLREIESSLGSKISVNYESDSYRTSILHNNYNLIIHSLEAATDNTVDTQIRLRNFDNVGDFVRTGDLLEILFLYYETVITTCESGGTYESYDPFVYKKKVHVKAVGSNFFTVEDNELRAILDFNETRGGTDCNEERYNAVSGGNIGVTHFLKPGGGLRVNNIVISDPFTDQQSKTAYTYEDPILNKSSGIVSYEPVGLASYNLHNPETSNEGPEMFKQELFGSFSNVLTKARSVPAPGVYYEYITVNESTIAADGRENLLPGSSRYHFQVFNEEMVEVHEDTFINSSVNAVRTTTGGESPVRDALKSKKLTIKDFTTRIGNLLSITLLDKEGNKISETINHYLHDGETNSTYEQKLGDFNQQGVLHENFINHRLVRKKNDKFDEIGVVSKIEMYPSIQVGETNINYRTGVKSSSKNLAFDFLSGQVVKTLSEDSYGNRFLSEIIPAYHHYPQMGHRVFGPSYKHMLTQEAETRVYKVNSFLDPTGILSAEVKTWSNGTYVLENSGAQTDIWREHQSYFWQGNTINETDGTGVVGDFVPFDFSASVQDEQWVKAREINIFNKWSKALEASDMYDRYSSVRMDSEGMKVIASVANSKLENAAIFSEEAITAASCPVTNLNKEQGVINTSRPHTGKYSLQVPSNYTAFSTSFSLAGGADSYLLSFWAHKDGLDKLELEMTTSTGTTTKVLNKTEGVQAGNFYLFTTKVSPQVKVKNIGASTIYLDDIRVHPVDASMKSYVYNAFGELEYVLDANNFFSRFEYDNMGRLKSTYLETAKFGEKQISTFSSNYGRENRDNLSCTLAKSGTYNPTIVAYGPDRNKEYLFTWYYKEGGTTQWVKYGFERGTSATYPVPEMCAHEVKCEVEDEKGRKGIAYTSAQGSEFVIANTYQDYPEMFRYSVELAGGSPPYEYVWKYRETPDGKLHDLMYATGSYYQFNIRNSAILCNGYEVVVNVYDQCRQRRHYVFPPVTLPALQTSSPTVDEATNTYSITASGGSNYYTYNWIKNGIQVASGSSNTYSFGAGNVTCSDEIKVVVLDYCGESKSYTYQSSTSGPLSVSINSLLSSDGTSARLYADATGGCEPYSYKWYDQFNNFSGSGAELLVNLACGDNTFTCKVTDSSNTLVSDIEYIYRTCDTQLEPALQN